MKMPDQDPPEDQPPDVGVPVGPGKTEAPSTGSKPPDETSSEKEGDKDKQ